MGKVKSLIVIDRWSKLKRNIWRSRSVYLMILPVVIYYLLFKYWPMYWLKIALYDYSPYWGFEGSEFIGFKNFIKFFQGADFWILIRNVLVLNLYSLIFCFPAPIILALLLNELRSPRLKKAVQTITYLPHFISMVAFVGLVTQFLSPSTGAMGQIMRAIGMQPIYFLGDAKYFRAVCVATGLWQATGWGAIVYLSALTSIDTNLYEAAMVDGANRWQRLIHITIPCIMPTIIIMLILRIGTMVTCDFEKVYLLQNSANIGVSEMIQTWVYKRGMIKYDYSMATTAGLFNSVIAVAMVAFSNGVSKKYSETGIW